jgi:hypothetical protein
MRYGSALVEKVVDGRKCVIRVGVGVERTAGIGRRVRLGEGLAESAASAGAWSGVSFAQRCVGRDNYDVLIREISGDVNCPMAGMGAAIAGAVAAWVACGDDWREADLGDTMGWSLRRPAGT